MMPCRSLAVLGIPALLLAMSGCTEHGAAATPGTTASSTSCGPSTLSVKTPEQVFTGRPATSVVTRSAPAVLDLWIADYPKPDAALTPGRPAAPVGHARVRLELLAAPGRRITEGGTFPAVAHKAAVGRATLIVETPTQQHAAYTSITGEAHLTSIGKQGVCGTFDIGDSTTRGTGTFSATLP